MGFELQRDKNNSASRKYVNARFAIICAENRHQYLLEVRKLRNDYIY